MMTTPEPDNLEKQLADLTRWQGPAPQLWRKALRTSSQTNTRSRVGLLIRRTGPFAAAACAVLAIGLASYWNLDHTGQSAGEPALYMGDLRELARRAEPAGAPVVAELAADGLAARDGRTTKHFWKHGANDGETSPQDSWGDWNQSYGLSVAGTSVGGTTTATSSAGGDSDRKVVRRVTIQLSTPDVRAVYLRASHLISQAKGEYIQDSDLTGADNQLQANLTLRVAAERLPEVLNQLRELGKVDSEQATGEDVTQQVVDNDARLRNEQRVEAELLKLLEKRENAPLNELLQLRDKLSEVRNSIERLVAERDRLSRLVNLATVLVLIRPADRPPVVAESSLRDYFTHGIAKAWKNGLRLLADTLAALLAILVGGLIWWALLALAIVLLIRHRRHRSPG